VSRALWREDVPLLGNREAEDIHLRAGEDAMGRGQRALRLE